MKYSEMKDWERNTRKRAQHKQYLKRKALGIQKKSKSGTQCDSQKWRNTAEYNEWRKAVLETGECAKCGSKENLEAHHILSAKDYPELRLDKTNGECICNKCHKDEHNEN